MRYLLETRIIKIVPLLNYDSFLEAQNQYKTLGTLNPYIKNQRNLECGGTSDGVNLNRNFPSTWNKTLGGSSEIKCDYDY